MQEINSKLALFCLFSLISVIIVTFINYFYFKLNFLFISIYALLALILIIIHLYQKNDIEFGSLKEKISFLFLSESLLLSFKTYSIMISRNEWSYFVIRKTIYETKDINLQPDMLSIIVSIIFYISLRIRNGILYEHNIKTCAFAIEYILFFSSLISILASNEYIKIPLYGETNITTKSLCIYSLVLSYIGIKSINKILLPISLFFIFGRIEEINNAMGKNGIFYIIFAFISISLHISSLTNIFSEIKEDFGYKINNIYITNINNNYNIPNIYEAEKQKIKEKANIPKEVLDLLINLKNNIDNDQKILKKE